MKTEKPLVTVLICVYNGEKRLKYALESALSINYENYEIIVVDDGSTDYSRRIIDLYKQKKDKFIHLHKINEGLASACNKGLELAKGEYLIRLDHDDEIHPDAIKMMVNIFKERNDIDFIYSDYMKKPIMSGEWIYTPLDNPKLFEMIAAGVMFKTEALREVGGYNDLYYEEVDLYMRLIFKEKKYLHIPYPLYFYYKLPSSMSENAELRRNGMDQIKKIYPNLPEYLKEIK